jgi:sulfur carrier protein
VICFNGHDQEYLPETVDALLTRLGIERRGVAVAVNGEIVRRAEWSHTVLEDECSIEIVTAAAGG